MNEFIRQEESIYSKPFIPYQIWKRYVIHCTIGAITTLCYNNISFFTIGQTDREKTIRELCKQTNISIANIDYTKFSQLTEGYAIADLVQLVDRALFYAHRNSTLIYFIISYDWNADAICLQI